MNSFHSFHLKKDKLVILIDKESKENIRRKATAGKDETRNGGPESDRGEGKDRGKNHSGRNLSEFC